MGQTMPINEKPNRDDFEKFIKEEGTTTLQDANFYADLGDKIVRNAISKNPNDFKNSMTNIEEDALLKLQSYSQSPGFPEKFKVSNMACCLLYAQIRANFKNCQGYAKGANINQYGDPAQSENAVINLMS